MERKMFGHRMKKRSPEVSRDPGLPPNYNAGRRDDDEGEAQDNPPDYEGREHMKYRNPGFSKHDIRYPKDEPHMKSHVSREEEHEAEDDYHMGIPDQTDRTLPAHIKRAHMLMDAPNQQDPKPLRGNIVHNVPYAGEEDETGEEEMGPHDMQSDEHSMPKEHRKKMIAAVVKRKMKKQGYNDRLDESLGERRGRKSQSYDSRRTESEGEEEKMNRRKFGAKRSAY